MISFFFKFFDMPLIFPGLELNFLQLIFGENLIFLHVQVFAWRLYSQFFIFVLFSFLGNTDFDQLVIVDGEILQF